MVKYTFRRGVPLQELRETSGDGKIHVQVALVPFLLELVCENALYQQYCPCILTSSCSLLCPPLL